MLFSKPMLTRRQTVPEKYARRVCNLIGLNTLRGLTIIHSSGDEGESQYATHEPLDMV